MREQLWRTIDPIGVGRLAFIHTSLPLQLPDIVTAQAVNPSWIQDLSNSMRPPPALGDGRTSDYGRHRGRSSNRNLGRRPSSACGRPNPAVLQPSHRPPPPIPHRTITAFGNATLICARVDMSQWTCSTGSGRCGRCWSPSLTSVLRRSHRPVSRRRWMKAGLGFEIEVTADVRWDYREKKYLARCEEFANITGVGVSPQAALRELEEGIRLWIRMAKPGSD